MTLQDHLVDIKTIEAKGANNLTATDKQKQKRSLQQLKITYTRLEKACTTHEKTLKTQLKAYTKKQDAIIAKTEKAEKAHRSTDKLDRERLLLMQEISTLGYQLDLLEKVIACPETKKLLSIP